MPQVFGDSEFSFVRDEEDVDFCLSFSCIICIYIYIYIYIYGFGKSKK